MDYFSRKTGNKFKIFNSIEEIKKIMKTENISIFDAIKAFEDTEYFNEDSHLVSNYELSDLLTAKTYNSSYVFSDDRIMEMAKAILNINIESLKLVSKDNYIVNDKYNLTVEESEGFKSSLSNCFYDFNLTLIGD